MEGKTCPHIYHNAERHPLGSTWPWEIYPIVIEGKTRKPGKVRVTYEKFTGLCSRTLLMTIVTICSSAESMPILSNDWVWDAEVEGWVCRDSEERRVHFATGRQ